MFFQNARLGPNEFWRYLIVVFLALLAYVLAQTPLVAAVNYLDGNINASTIAEMGLDANLALFLVLLSPVAGFFALRALIPLFHKRPANTALTGRKSLDWSRIFFGAGLWLLLGASMEFAFYLFDPANYSLIFEWRKFLPLLLICLLFIPIQTSFEELLFRGYLMQGFGGLGNRWFPLLITSVLFGALHLANPEVAAFGIGYMLFFYIGMGLMLGICTIMDEGTELALGMHASNNLFAALVLTFQHSALETPAIFKMQELDPKTMIVGWLIAVVIYLFILHKKYQWTSWKKLFAKIEFF